MKHNGLLIEKLDTLEVEIAPFAVDESYFVACFLPQAKSLVSYQKSRYSSMKLSCFFCSSLTRLLMSSIV